MARKFPPTHPGEILKEEFLVPLGISQYRLAQDLRIPATRVSQIVRGKRSISADTAMRLARYFATSDKFWMNLQSHYDLEVESDRLGNTIQKEVPVFRPAV